MARNSKLISLDGPDGSITVTVYELTLRQLQNDLEPFWKTVTAAMDASQGGESGGVAGVLMAMPENLARIIAGSTTLDEESVADMGAADLLTLADAWIDVNAAFFGKAATLKSRVSGMFAAKAAPKE